MTKVTTYRPHASWPPKDGGCGSCTRGGGDGGSSELSEKAARKVCRGRLPVGMGPFGLAQVLTDHLTLKTYLKDVSQGRTRTFSVSFSMHAFSKTFKVGGWVPGHFLPDVLPSATNTGVAAASVILVWSEHMIGEKNPSRMGQTESGASVPGQALSDAAPGTCSVFSPLSCPGGRLLPCRHPHQTSLPICWRCAQSFPRIFLPLSIATSPVFFSQIPFSVIESSRLLITEVSPPLNSQSCLSLLPTSSGLVLSLH